jgi:anti-sigma-K factor RskA
MSDIEDQNSLPGDELVAAEYALGVLDGPERAAAARRIAHEAGFARMVVAWEERLAPWAGEIDEVAAPPHVWDRVAAVLPPQRPQVADVRLMSLADIAQVRERLDATDA